MKFISPLHIMASIRKKFILNLNQYRNTYYRTLNSCKIRYKEHMEEQIKKAKKFGKVICIYTVYQKTLHRFDVGNVCCVHEKFFEDALVELGKLEDDNIKFIPLVIYKRGEVDKVNPRVEIEVVPFDKDGIEYVHDIINKLAEEEMNGTK